MATKKTFLVEYKKFSSDEDTRSVRIVASTPDAALKKAQQIVRKNYADRVVALAEEYTGVYVA